MKLFQSKIGSHAFVNQRDNIISISKEAVRRTNGALKEFPQALIIAEKRVQRKLQASIRLILATILFWIVGLISLGATVTGAIAQSITKEQPTKVKSAS